MWRGIPFSDIMVLFFSPNQRQHFPNLNVDVRRRGYGFHWFLGTETSELAPHVFVGCFRFLPASTAMFPLLAIAPPVLCSSLSSPLYLSNVIFQFVLLLVMFVKPMLLSQGKTQSGGTMYRRVVRRNVACTTCIVFSYIITTLVVIFALLDASHKVRFSAVYAANHTGGRNTTD